MANSPIVRRDSPIRRLQFEVGDLVTRDGTDVHRVLYVQPDQHSMEVVCVKAPESGWCKVGDKEFNLCRRYDFAGEVFE